MLEKCGVPGCGKKLRNVMGRAAHMRMHVRAGEAREIHKFGYTEWITDPAERLGVLPWRLAKAVEAKFITLVQAEQFHAEGHHNVAVKDGVVYGIGGPNKEDR